MKASRPLKTVCRIAAPALLVACTLMAAGLICVIWLSRDLPAESAIRGTILDAYPTRANAVWVPLTRISGNLQTAVIAWEDPIFYRHRGFNFREIIRCIGANLRAGAYVRGGSTITQQVAKNMYLSPEKTIRRKIREAVLTLRIESALSKEEILKIYLNIAHWGPDTAGAEAAANRYMGKHADRLTWGEAALLAGMLQNPVRFDPEKNPGLAKSQQLRVLNKLLRLEIITREEYDLARDESIIVNRTEAANFHSYYLRYLWRALRNS